MRSVWVLLMMLAFSGASSFSQDIPAINEWRTITAKNDGVTFQMPNGAVFVEASELNKLGTRSQYLADGIFLYLFADSLSKDAQVSTVKRYLKENKQLSNTSENFHSGVVCEFIDEDGFVHWVAVKQTQNRIVAVHAVSRSKGETAVSNFQIVSKYLRSVSIDNGNGTIWAPFDSQIREPEMESSQIRKMGSAIAQAKESETVSRPNSSLGQGSGSGNGATSGQGSGNSSTRRDTVPLKILSKEKAKYTDFARFYDVAGTVLLRTTF